MNLDRLVHLKQLAHDHRVVWSRSKVYRYVEAEKRHVGYELELAGTCVSSKPYSQVESIACESIFITLRLLAHWLLTTKRGLCKFELCFRENQVSFWSRHQNRPDLTMGISVVHTDYSLDESDEAAHECIEQMGTLLRQIGVHEY